MLGFELPENFKAPLFSPSGRELWQRWHMTLSFWLRDYIYFSLGGSKTGEWRTYLNLIITMTVGGIWHGADYTFIAWGFYWGVILATERFFVKRFGWDDGESSNRFLNVIRVQIIFVLFSFSAILFRSNSAGKMVQHVVGLIANMPGKLSGILIANGSNWLDQATSLISGPSPFKLERMENMEKLAYSYLAFLFFISCSINRNGFRKSAKIEPGFLYFARFLLYLQSRYILKIPVFVSIANFRGSNELI